MQGPVKARSQLLLAAAVQLALSGCSAEESPTPLGHAEAVDAPTTTAASVASSSASTDVDLPAADTPVVDLAGMTTLASPPDGPTVAATRWLTRVYKTPSREANVLGFLRAGAVVGARQNASGPLTHGRSKDCTEGWRGIEPAGWVCLDDATADLDDPIVRATRRRPDVAHRLPYMYGTVTRGGPVYNRIPTEAHLEEFEPSLKDHLDKWRRDEISGARYGLDVWLRYTTGRTVPSALEALERKITDEDVPWFLKDHRRVPVVSQVVRQAGEDGVKVDQVNRRQGRSFTHSFLFEGRRYNVTPDLTVIPADRFRPIRGSAFHGWQVGEELELPFALVRRPNAWKYRWDGKRMVEHEHVEWRSAHLLTGKQKFYDKKLHYETKDGFWLNARYAGRVDPAKRWPKWAKQGARWIDVNITKQVLVAYEGKKMVYATIVSTGEDGLGDPEESTATKTGIFRIHTKWVTTTMDSDIVGEEFELRDVPYVQYFEGGYALHGAYWHDGFGRPKSHGCINLAPEDARRLFFWTDPQVPQGWHGARKALTGTIIFVHP
ncbi:MAG TPA: L,D-transpeptidase [Polyangiaceae bacterium]|nr:L,D-transpeptidase [Polyangiaceae bacterium]